MQLCILECYSLADKEVEEEIAEKKKRVASAGGAKSQFYIHMYLFFNIQELQYIDLVLVLQRNDSQHYEALFHTLALPRWLRPIYLCIHGSLEYNSAPRCKLPKF